MKILVLGGRYDDYSVGGVRKYLTSVIPRLASKHEVVVLAAKRFSERKLLKDFSQSASGSRLRVKYVTSVNFRPIPYSWAFWLILRKAFATVDLYKKFQFDVIYSHEWVDGTVGRIITYLLKLHGRNVKHVYHPHGVVSFVTGVERFQWHRSNPLWGLILSLITYNEKKNVQSADAVIMFTKYHAKFGEKWGAKIVYPIPNGVDTKKFNPKVDFASFIDRYKIPRDAKKIVYCGRVIIIKGVEYLIAAMSIVAKIFPDIVLVIVGEFPQLPKSYWEGVARKYDVFDKVIFTGGVEDFEVPQAMRMADVYCQLTAPYYGFEISLMEACACGASCIAIDCEERKEVFRNAVIYVPWASPPETAEAIAKLLDDDRLRRELSEEARSLSLEYDWQRVADRLIDVISEMQ